MSPLGCWCATIRVCVPSKKDYMRDEIIIYRSSRGSVTLWIKDEKYRRRQRRWALSGPIGIQIRAQARDECEREEPLRLLIAYTREELPREFARDKRRVTFSSEANLLWTCGYGSKIYILWKTDVQQGLSFQWGAYARRRQRRRRLGRQRCIPMYSRVEHVALRIIRNVLFLLVLRETTCGRKCREVPLQVVLGLTSFSLHHPVYIIEDDKGEMPRGASSYWRITRFAHVEGNRAELFCLLIHLRLSCVQYWFSNFVTRSFSAHDTRTKLEQTKVEKEWKQL